MAIYLYQLVGYEESLIDFHNMSLTYRSYYPMYLYQGDGMNYRFSKMRIISTYSSYPLYLNQYCADEAQVPCYFEFTSTYLDTSFSMSITNYTVVVDVSNTSSAFSLTPANSSSATVSVRDVVQATSVNVIFHRCNNTYVSISNVSHSSASYPSIALRWGKEDGIPSLNHTAQLLNSRFDSLAVSAYNTYGGDNIDLLVHGNYYRVNTVSGRLHINATFFNNTVMQTSWQEAFDTSTLNCGRTDLVLSGIHDQGCHFKIINNTITRSGSYINSYYALDLQFSQTNEFSTSVVTGNYVSLGTPTTPTHWYIPNLIGQ